jgi:hypothetical protein
VHGERTVLTFTAAGHFLSFVGIILFGNFPDPIQRSLKNWHSPFEFSFRFQLRRRVWRNKFIYVNNLINCVLQLSVLEKVNLINKIKKVECAHDGEFREYWWSNGIGSTPQMCGSSGHCALGAGV